MPPIKHRRRFTWILGTVCVLMALGFFAGRYYLLYKIRATLHEKIFDLRKNGVSIKFESANINTWSGDLIIRGLYLGIGDSLNRDFIAEVPNLTVRGVGIIPFLESRNINIDQVSMESPLITFRSNADLMKTKTREAFFEDLYIDNIHIVTSSIHIKDTLGTDTLALIETDLNINHLGLERIGDSLEWRQSDLLISNFSFQLPHELYAYAVKEVKLNLTKKIFEVDSLKITPTLGRRAFMRKVKHQTDYFRGVVAYIRISGLKLEADPKINLLADRAAIKLRLMVYRDKRLPFTKKTHSRLPSHFIQSLPFALRVDTLKVEDSFVSYEEFPAEGDSSGVVFFDKLNATITSVSSIPEEKQVAVMNAYSKFMGKGDLRAHFIFPYDTNKAYKAWGTLQNFDMTSLNNMLGPAAKARVESGTMTNLKFHFRYNEVRSDGEVELNYENLRIVSLRQDKNNRARVSLIKTLLLNIFVIRKNMDEDVSDDKKKGTIMFYRDQHRSIFNYWWKSLFSGIKSAYKLDKLENLTKKNSQKDDKKEKKRS